MENERQSGMRTPLHGRPHNWDQAGYGIDFTYVKSAFILYGGNRGYYTAAWGYEFYLRVLKVSLTSERSERVRNTFSTRKSWYFISIYIINALHSNSNNPPTPPPPKKIL